MARAVFARCRRDPVQQWSGVRRQEAPLYATLGAMQRVTASIPALRFPSGVSNAWLARRWYYTPKTHRAYSVRQISPGDRRLLAEFALTLLPPASGNEREGGLRDLASMLFDRVIGAGTNDALGFAALEGTAAGDRVIGVAAYAPGGREEGVEFTVGVLPAYRDEQVGRTVLSTLLRQAKRAGIPRLAGEMHWSNRAMHTLARSLGFDVEAHPRDRNLRRLVLQLK